VLLAHTSDAVFALRAGVVAAWNPRAAELFGWSEAEASGQPAEELLRVPDDPTGWNRFTGALDAATPLGTGFAHVHLARRHDRPVVVEGVVWTEPERDWLVVLLRDQQTERLAEELERERLQLANEAAELWHRAFHDPLTNLANRNLFRQRADQLLDRPAQYQLGVLLLDLDGFDAVNDALGHAVGDRLFVQVAERLAASVGEGSTVARPGGYELAVLLHDVESQADAEGVATRVIEELAEPFDVDGRLLTVSTSIGIVVAHSNHGGVDALMRDADVALHEARARGRGAYACFEGEMHIAALERLEIEADLRRALEGNQLRLHYQPIAGLRSGTVHSVEALLRWVHPTRGFVSPALFIPVAESTGLIVAVGEWVLREACRQAREWHRRHPDIPPISVAVNLSGIQLQLPHFSDTVAAVLAETGLAPDCLIIEITESQIMENIDPILVNLHAIQALGVRLSIDDFGTGYSSLARLRTLPVDELKIDRSFVQEVDEAGHEGPLVAAIVTMAHSLDLHVVGEGVETADQLQALLEAGCDRAQGYLLGRPAPADQVEQLITQPILVLRLAAAAAALGDAAERLDVDVMEALGAVLAEGEDQQHLVAGILELVMRLTGLDCAYATHIDWAAEELEVMQVLGDCPLAAGNKYSWAGSTTPDVYVDARLVKSKGMETYISVPILGEHGGLMGTLCAASREKRVLTRAQLGALEVLARIIGEQLSGQRDAGRLRIAS
jgi:diguanylate cyclase (GGDEF)-like protein